MPLLVPINHKRRNPPTNDPLKDQFRGIDRLGACWSNRCCYLAGLIQAWTARQALSLRKIDQLYGGSAAECAQDFVPKDHVSRFIVGLVRERPGSQGDHGQLWEAGYASRRLFCA